MSRLISFAVLIAIIIFIGLMFYKVLVGFFVPVFLAAVLVVVFRPLHKWVLYKTGHRERIAAAATTLLIALVLVLPIALVGSAAAVQGLRLIKENDASVVQLRLKTIRSALGLGMPAYDGTLRLISEEIAQVVKNTDEALMDEPNAKLIRIGSQLVNQIDQLQAEATAVEAPVGEEAFEHLRELAAAVGQPSELPGEPSRVAMRLKSDFGKLKTQLLGGPVKSLAREYANPTAEDIEQVTSSVVAYARPRLLSVTGATGAYLVKFIFSSVILVVATFFFLYDGPSMIETVMYLSPLDDTYEQELLLEFDKISRAVVLATILSAIVQGLTAGIGYYFAGMEFLVLLILLTTAFAMVPFVGPAVVWVPVCLYLGVVEGRIVAATVLAIWGVAAVGTIDNVVKAFVLHGQSQLHPLLALLSVLGGVQTLGPVGIVVGPMVVAMLQTLLSILQRELLHFDREQFVLATERKPDGKRRRRTASVQAGEDAEEPGGGRPTEKSSDLSSGKSQTAVPDDSHDSD